MASGWHRLKIVHRLPQGQFEELVRQLARYHAEGVVVDFRIETGETHLIVMFLPGEGIQPITVRLTGMRSASLLRMQSDPSP